TWPMRKLPAPIGALLALALGGGLGVLVMSLATWTSLAAFIAKIKQTLEDDLVLGLAVTAALTFGPMIIGLFLGKDDD
ncbi:MAG: hypothetical protein NT062_28310, partial [Proteobacteria bacterium]|nr:hypothetical protein [Pseudomonadota bacterium]